MITLHIVLMAPMNTLHSVVCMDHFYMISIVIITLQYSYTKGIIYIIVTRICPAGFFPCHNNRCVSSSLQCDGVNDCRDHSDELNCRCERNEFRCTNSRQCIKSIHRST